MLQRIEQNLLSLEFLFCIAFTSVLSNRTPKGYRSFCSSAFHLQATISLNSTPAIYVPPQKLLYFPLVTKRHSRKMHGKKVFWQTFAGWDACKAHKHHQSAVNTSVKWKTLRTIILYLCLVNTTQEKATAYLENMLTKQTRKY